MKKKVTGFFLVCILTVIALSLSVFTASAALTGDVEGTDGKVTAADARLILRASVGLETFSEKLQLIADTDENGKITASDARTALRMSVGLEETKHFYETTVKVEATCTEKAVYIKTCTECDDVFEVEGAPLGHDFSVKEVITEVTCEADGLEKYSCTRCGITEDVRVPKGHIWNIPEATCTEGMYCSRGDHEGTKALGHTTDWGTCDRCKVFITDRHPEAAETVKAKYDEAVAAATKAYAYIEETQTAASWLKNRATKARPVYVKALEAYKAAYDACGDIPEFAEIKAYLNKNIENINGIIAQIDVIKTSKVYIDSNNYFDFVTPIDDLNFMNSDSVIDTNKALSKLILWTSAL